MKKIAFTVALGIVLHLGMNLNPSMAFASELEDLVAEKNQLLGRSDALEERAEEINAELQANGCPSAQLAVCQELSSDFIDNLAKRVEILSRLQKIEYRIAELSAKSDGKDETSVQEFSVGF